MFPPGCGNDKLDAGDIYLISMFGTNQMLTAVGKELCLRDYQEGRHDQMWICEMGLYQQIGMCNRHTRFFLGRDEQDNPKCLGTFNGAWERLTFMELSLGGYSLMMNPQDKNNLGPL